MPITMSAAVGAQHQAHDDGHGGANTGCDQHRFQRFAFDVMDGLLRSLAGITDHLVDRLADAGFDLFARVVAEGHEIPG